MFCAQSFVKEHTLNLFYEIKIYLKKKIYLMIFGALGTLR